MYSYRACQLCEPKETMRMTHQLPYLQILHKTAHRHCHYSVKFTTLRCITHALHHLQSASPVMLQMVCMGSKGQPCFDYLQVVFHKLENEQVW